MLQILRTTHALIKYYEGSDDSSAASIAELQSCMQRTINQLSAIAEAEKLSALPTAEMDCDPKELASNELRRPRLQKRMQSGTG
jgi:hypothetical protein